MRQRHRPFLYWFQKYSIDGVPEWETPAVDQTALIPWGLERHYRRTGDLDLVAAVWPMIEQAAAVCCGDSGGHPGLRLLEDLNLISSAGSGDQLFGAFLYSNACVVAGLRAAARLASQLGMNGSAGAGWHVPIGSGTRESCQAIATSRPGSPGLTDPESGRFLQARRLSKLRGLWTDNPDFLIEHSTTLDITMLGAGRPVRPAAGLRPAVDPDRRRHPPRQRGTQGRSQRPGSHDLRAGAHRAGPARDSDQHDVSSLATFWMVRFLIQLGRETGQARHWTRALSHARRDRRPDLAPRAVACDRPAAEMESGRQVANPGGTAWRLHAMLIDTMLDLAGLDYDAVEHRLVLRPILPGPWPQTGIKQSFPCGDVSYLLERPIGGKVYHLNLKTQLEASRHARGRAHLPGPLELGPWQASPADARARPRPAHGPAALERHPAVERQRVELDLGLSGSTAPPSSRQGPSGSGSARNSRYTRLPRPDDGTCPACRAAAPRKTTPFSKSCPKSPYCRTSGPAMRLEALARLEPDHAGRVVGLNHLDVRESRPPAPGGVTDEQAR